MRETVDLSVIVPFKDESERLPRTLSAILAFFNGRGGRYEIILVDDGSVDDTLAAIKPFLRPEVVVLRHAKNQGKGAAIRTGILFATGRRLLFMDADLSTPIEEIDALNRALDEGFSVAIGSRCAPGAHVREKQPSHRVLIGKIGNALIRLVLGLPYADTQCGFKLFTREAGRMLFESLRFPRWSFDFEILYRAKQRGYQVKEVPVEWHDAPGSKFHPVRDAVRCVIDLCRIRFSI